jgi:TonB family protein
MVGCSSQLENTESQGFVEPSLENKPRLLYPKIAEEENYSGDVKALIYISETGVVSKVDVLESSGYDILDEAAVDYFKRFIFKPATGNGKPISCRAIWNIQFNLVDQKSNAKDYVEEILDLFNEVAVAAGEEKNEIQDNIFSLHKQFVNSMWNSANFNATIAKVVSPEIVKEWTNGLNGYPLSFLLYHDFTARFPDYHNLSEVKKELENSLKSDIEYINQSPARSNGTSVQQELLNKIKRFVETNYPNLLNDNLGFDGVINS